MLEFAQKLHDELLLKLDGLNENHDIKTFSPDQRLSLILASIDRLKEKLKAYQFSRENEEIYFFKELLPLFLSLHFYYREKFDLESIELLGTPQLRNGYFDRLFIRIEDFFKENGEFLKYYRSGKTNMDKYYFLRNSSFQQEHMDLITSLIDPSYCTVYSIKVANILAYSKLDRDIRNIFLGEKDEGLPLTNKKTKLEWTDTKAGLVELIYSLKAKGAFNNGKASLKSITEYFENIFSIHPDNTSRSFQEILSRKTGYTKYIDKLRDNQNARIDEIEDGNMSL